LRLECGWRESGCSDMKRSGAGAFPGKTQAPQLDKETCFSVGNARAAQAEFKRNTRPAILAGLALIINFKPDIVDILFNII